MTDTDVSAFLRRIQERAVRGNDLEDLPDMQPLIEGVLYRNSLAWMVGPSGHGKTFLGIDIAGSVAEGIPWHSRETVQGTVLYVIAEPGKLKTRVRAWKHEHQAEMQDVYFLPESILICETSQRRALIRYAKKVRPVLIVFDTQARMTLGMEENSAKEMGQFVSALDEIRDATGACVLTIHHPDKSGTGMRGSNATLGAAQTVIEVQKKPGYVELSFPKQKDNEDDFNLFFSLVPSQGSLVPRPIASETPKTRKSLKRVSEPYPPVGGRASETSVTRRPKKSVSRKTVATETNKRSNKATDFIQNNPGCTVAELMVGGDVSRATAYRVMKAVSVERTSGTAPTASLPPASKKPPQRPKKTLRRPDPHTATKKTLKRPENRSQPRQQPNEEFDELAAYKARVEMGTRLRYTPLGKPPGYHLFGDRYLTGSYA